MCLELVVAVPHPHIGLAVDRQRRARQQGCERTLRLEIAMRGRSHDARNAIPADRTPAASAPRRRSCAAPPARAPSGRPAVNVRANSSPVTAPSMPIDVPDGSRPVSFAAPRMVDVAGKSTKSPGARPTGAAPMRRRIEPVRVLVVQQVAALEKERTAFVEERFERREVHFGGIRFHLAEVRIDRRFERQVRADADLRIEADPPVNIRAIGERIPRLRVAEQVRRARHVWQHFDAPARPDAADAMQVAKPRGPPLLRPPA